MSGDPALAATLAVIAAAVIALLALHERRQS